MEMSLQKQIDQARAEIRSDDYPVSIGELISIYESNEIDIHPEFQRFYRWDEYQKSRLIESILLGIPIPPIYVAQRKNGIWDVVDGLQRLSTIYEFVGILKDENGKILPPLTLKGTKYLPDLEGKQWSSIENFLNGLTPTQQLLIKRAKIPVSIILRESDRKAKFELFQRLNTGGSPLSPQEVRNSILVMLNPETYRYARNLSNNEAFKECISLTDRAESEQYDMDLFFRFLIFRTLDQEHLKQIGDLNEFLADRMVELVEKDLLNEAEEEKAFLATFDLLVRTVNADSFHKYDAKKGKFQGGFLVSAYELLAMGVGYNYKKYLNLSLDDEEIKKQLIEKLKYAWSNLDFTSSTGSGVRASSRLPKTIPLGRQLFDPDNSVP